MKHGFYARSQPTEEVLAVMAENIQGIEEEIVGLRTLGRGLLERQARARNNQEAARLGEAYSLAAYRLGEMIKAEGELAERKKAGMSDEEVLEGLDRLADALGEEPVSEQIRKERLGGEAGLAAGARKVAEEVAALRYVLRNTFRMAMETPPEAAATREHIRLVEIYGSGCPRLVRLLKMRRPARVG